jgi:hypothetical protein
MAPTTLPNLACGATPHVLPVTVMPGAANRGHLLRDAPSRGRGLTTAPLVAAPGMAPHLGRRVLAGPSTVKGPLRRGRNLVEGSTWLHRPSPARPALPRTSSPAHVLVAGCSLRVRGPVQPPT